MNMAERPPSFYDLISDDSSEQEVQEGFAVCDLQSADWALGKALSAQKRINEIEAYAEAAIAEARARIEREVSSYRHTVERMSTFLEPWVRERLAGEKRKSLRLLSGRVGLRKSQPSLLVKDEAAAVADLEKLGLSAFIRTKKEVKKDEVKANVKAGGALPEGCELVPGSEHFYLDEGKEEQ